MHQTVNKQLILNDVFHEIFQKTDLTCGETEMHGISVCFISENLR